MYFRVEIQREHGRKLATPVVVFGQLQTYVRAFGSTSRTFLQISDAAQWQRQPHLYTPVLAAARHNGLLFTGMELTDDDAWVSQTWWCAYTTVEQMTDEIGSARPKR